MTANDTDDIWTGQQASPKGDSTAAVPGQPHGLQTMLLDKITLLDGQFGIDPKRHVPEGLEDELFGQPEGAPAPLNTFAVLDAANVANLPELLASSGLEHHCLFIGEAREELAEVAPWIVQLAPDHRLTRNLFTTGRAAWQLWDKNPGMILRAPKSCEEMHKHLRKFLKVQDDAGKWFYFRFWEGATLQTVAQSSPEADLARLYCEGMIAYGRHSTPDGPALAKSWVAH